MFLIRIHHLLTNLIHRPFVKADGQTSVTTSGLPSGLGSDNGIGWNGKMALRSIFFYADPGVESPGKRTRFRQRERCQLLTETLIWFAVIIPPSIGVFVFIARCTKKPLLILANKNVPLFRCKGAKNGLLNWCVFPSLMSITIINKRCAKKNVFRCFR